MSWIYHPGRVWRKKTFNDGENETTSRFYYSFLLVGQGVDEGLFCYYDTHFVEDGGYTSKYVISSGLDVRNVLYGYNVQDYGPNESPMFEGITRDASRYIWKNEGGKNILSTGMTETNTYKDPLSNNIYGDGWIESNLGTENIDIQPGGIYEGSPSVSAHLRSGSYWVRYQPEGRPQVNAPLGYYKDPNGINSDLIVGTQVYNGTLSDEYHGPINVGGYYRRSIGTALEISFKRFYQIDLDSELHYYHRYNTNSGNWSVNSLGPYNIYHVSIIQSENITLKDLLTIRQIGLNDGAASVRSLCGPNGDWLTIGNRRSRINLEKMSDENNEVMDSKSLTPTEFIQQFTISDVIVENGQAYFLTGGTNNERWVVQTNLNTTYHCNSENKKICWTCRLPTDKSGWFESVQEPNMDSPVTFQFKVNELKALNLTVKSILQGEYKIRWSSNYAYINFPRICHPSHRCYVCPKSSFDSVSVNFHWVPNEGVEEVKNDFSATLYEIVNNYGGIYATFGNKIEYSSSNIIIGHWEADVPTNKIEFNWENRYGYADPEMTVEFSTLSNENERTNILVGEAAIWR